MAKVTESTGVTLRPKQYRKLLLTAIRTGMRVLTKGAPGIGKTEIKESVAAEAGVDMITMYPSVSEPVDYKGAPWVVVKDGEVIAEFVPFGDLRIIAEYAESGKTLLVFIDDLGQATQATQAAVMQLLDKYRKFPNIIFWGATNRRSDRAGVTGILEPVKSRFDTIVELRPNADDWSEWAIDNDQPPELIAYIRNVRPELLHKFEPTADIENSPNCRTWAKVGKKILPVGLEGDVRFAAIVGAVGEHAAQDFESYLQLIAKAPSLDSIIAHPETAPIPDEASVMYAVTSGLAQRATKENFDQIATYIIRMHDEGLGDMCSYLVQDAARRTREVTQTTGWKRLAKSPVAALIHTAIEMLRNRK